MHVNSSFPFFYNLAALFVYHTKVGIIFLKVFCAFVLYSFTNRYKDSFHAVQKERHRVLDEQHAAQQAELFAQQRVDLASQQAHGNGNIGHGNVGNGSNGFRSQGSGAVPNGHNSTQAVTTSPAVSSPAGASTTTATESPTQSQAEQRAAATEQAYNQAKLDLAAAEDTYETKRAVAEEVTVTVRAEATRLESLERVQLVVSFYFIIVLRCSI